MDDATDTRVLCLPFAGGGAGFYRAWQQVPPGLAVVPTQLPGREERFAEDPWHDVHDAVDALLPPAVAATIGAPTVVFGHSLGAVLAFEVTRGLVAAGVDVRLLVVSGSPGPWSGRHRRATGLGDDDFVARVEEFAGFRHDALADPDMRELLLPTLRADVEMHENYKPVSDEPISVPIVSVRGDGDRLVSHEEAAQWSQATTAGCRVVEVPGEHMYLVETPERVLDLIAAIASVPTGR